MSNFEELKAGFTLVTKRIIKEKLTKNVEKHKEYIRDLIPAYNKIVEYVAYKERGGLLTSDQIEYKRELTKIRERFGECLRRLNINIELKSNLLLIYKVDPLIEVLEELIKNNTEALNASQYFTDEEDEELEGAIGGFDPNEKTSDKESKPSTVNQPEANSNTDRRNENFHIHYNNNNLNMARELSVPEFMRLAAQTINYKYSGDPLELDSFVDSIEYLQIVTTDALKDTLFRFVKTKLAGKAKEVVPNDAQNIEAIINALKNKIKPDSSKVIAGRMMALRLDKKQVQDFSKNAEELADAFKRSLIVEGITQNKANEMSIDKTVEMCRASAKNDLFRSILAASSFENPKEVIAKLVVETATDNTEKQVLAYQKYNNNNGRGRGRGSNRYNNGNNGRRNYNENNNNRRGNNNNRRGRGRGNNRYNNYNNRNNYNNNNQNSNRNNYVRYAEAPPQQLELGFQDNSNRNGQ